MTVEEIRAMCDSVINTTNQMDKDYEILKEQKYDKMEEIGNKIEDKLKEIYSQYKEIFQSLITKAESIKENDNTFYMYTHRKIKAPKLHNYDFSSENCLFCAFYKDTLIFSTCIAEYDACKSEGNPYGLRITSDGWYSAGCNSTSYKSILEAFKYYLGQDNFENVINIMTFMLNNMEDLVQKIIAEAAKKILNYTTKRNAKITDNL